MLTFDFMRRNWRTGLCALALTIGFLPDGEAAKQWRVKEDCTLIENESNDGDSIHVRVNKRHYIFRLYWVDTPETDLRIPERVAEQAEYFGLTTEETIAIGKQAVAFTRQFLSTPFRVHTKFADAMGSSARDRDYALIEKDGKFLHMELVRNGLARIHGLQEVSDDMPNAATMRSRLKYAEQEAKKEKLGAWSKGGGKGDTLPDRVTLQRSVTVLDVEEPSRSLGILRAGASVEILGAETPTLIRIQFKVGEGSREGLCQRGELGI